VEARALLEQVYGNDPGPGVTPGQVDHVLLVSAWFRKHPEERTNLLTPAEANEVEGRSVKDAEPRVRRRSRSG
jgi:hypothetical protein